MLLDSGVKVWLVPSPLLLDGEEFVQNFPSEWNGLTGWVVKVHGGKTNTST